MPKAARAAADFCSGVALSAATPLGKITFDLTVSSATAGAVVLVAVLVGFTGVTTGLIATAGGVDAAGAGVAEATADLL